MIWIHQLLIVFLSFTLIHGLGDPYKVLGVHRKATISEIKKAYKKLVKEWHPDKNDDPRAPSRFMEVTESYELLTDPDRRKLYDNFGRVEESRPRRDSTYRHMDPFEEILTGPGYRFKFTDDITLFHRLSITSRAYENIVVPKSFRTPHLLLFYSDWCFACLQIEPVWRRVMEELEPIGVAVATVHAENEKTLARKLRISSLPTLVLLIEGRANFYRESLYSVQKIVELVRSKLPSRLVTRVEDANIEQFLSGWRDNKVRALVFQRTDNLRLRYLLAAFFHRERVAFGFVPPGASTAELRAKFQVPSDQDTLFLFNELPDRPMASLSMADIPIHTIHDLIANNNFLLLPRLSSQSLLDALCPGGMPTTRRRLCVILVTEDSSAHDLPRDMMRRLALDSHYSKERVRYMYVFLERQPGFISALTSGEGSGVDPALQVLLMLRRDTSHVRYEWVDLPGTELWASYNTTKQALDEAIHRVLHTSQALRKEAVIGELRDEQLEGVVGRVVSVFLQTLELFQDNLHKEHVLPTLSLIATMLFIGVAGYAMNYLMKLEEKRVREECSVHGSGKRKTMNGSCNYTPELKIHELRGETYNGLVRLLKPGCRTIVVLLDDQTKAVLLARFHKAAWPYRKYKSLQFGFVNLDRKGCVGWYTEILSLSLPVPRQLSINKKNCVGTVLSLNGLSKYFCMYHAKHPEGVSKAKTRMKRMLSNQVGLGTPGAFMGFEESTSESELSDVEQGHRNSERDKSPEVMLVDELLDGLPNWLDRLFEGTTHRYYLNYWPEFKL